MDRVVVDVDALVGAHLQGLLDGVGGGVGADRQHGDLTLAGLDDLQGLLDGVLVELGQQPVDVLAVGRCCQMSLNVRSAWASGTYLTQTTMFMGERPLPLLVVVLMELPEVAPALPSILSLSARSVRTRRA